VVEAEKFVLRSSDGKTRGEFGLSGDIAVLRLNDGAEKSRAEITVDADGSPNLALHDARGRDRAYLHLHDDLGGLSFGLKDDHDVVRVLAVVGPDGTPGLGLMDENGATRVNIIVEPGGTAVVRLNDKNEKLRAAVTADADGVQGLFITDADGAYKFGD
jgi:hypothetical protein